MYTCFNVGLDAVLGELSQGQCPAQEHFDRITRIWGLIQ